MNVILQEPKTYTEPVTLPVVCRPDQGYWILLVILNLIFTIPLLCNAISGAGAPVDLSLAEARLLFAGLIAIILGISLVYGLWLARATITAEENGLRWRGIGRWQVASWHEVTDYYQKPQLETHAINVVECGARRLIFSGGVWNKKSCLWLRNAVAAYAINARPTEWQVLGTRPGVDWPRTFGYDTPENRGKVHQFSIQLTFLTLVLIPLWGTSYSTMWWKAISLTSVLGAAAWLGVKLWLIWIVKRVAHRHFDEQITVTLEGICWEKKDVSVSASWDEVIDCYILENGLTLRMILPDGSIDFYKTIEDCDILKEIIKDSATQVKAKAWRTEKYTEAMRETDAQWSNERVEGGDRIYHYRVPSNQTLVSNITVLIAMPVVFFWICRGGICCMQPQCCEYCYRYSNNPGFLGMVLLLDGIGTDLCRGYHAVHTVR